MRVRSLFDAASDLTGTAREALLADPSHPPEVVAEVRSLLGHAGGLTAFADQQPRLDAPAMAEPAPRDFSGRATVNLIWPACRRPSSAG